MATVSFRPGKVSVTIAASSAIHVVPQEFQDVAGGLYPVRLAAWELDPYRLANGWPTQVPTHDVHARSYVSAEGDVLADRLSARDVDTAAHVRWIADSDTWDITDLRWRSWGGAATLDLVGGAGTEPVLINEYEYKFNNELFLVDGMQFDADSGDHLELELTNALGGVAGYTVILVGSFTTLSGNDVPYSGVWCPADTTEAWMSATLQGTSLYLETEQTQRQRVLNLANLLSEAAPLMLALVFDRPNATFYAASGPSSIIKASIQSGSDVVPLHPSVYLGRSGTDLTHTSDMTLMDVGLYATALTPAQVRSEFSTLSSIYGGDR